jgi:hypothetical protein
MRTRQTANSAVDSVYLLTSEQRRVMHEQ